MSAEKLDELFGDPWNPDNPVGYAAVLDADERREPLASGLRLLDDFGLDAEFVPAVEGGRLERADHLAEILRTVFRHDPRLAVEYAGSLIASTGVWIAGDVQQRRAVSDLLLHNGCVAPAFEWPAHGEGLPPIRRPDATVLLAATGSNNGLFLVRGTGSHESAPGTRGVALPAGALIGAADEGPDIVSRAYRLIGGVTSALTLGALDTALRTALANSFARRLYGGTVADIPYVAATLARVHADLLAVDALASVVARAAHLVPEAMVLYAPALGYLAARIVPDAFDELRAVLGARALLREGPYAVFQKMARDATPVGIARASRATCLAAIQPRLTGWETRAPAPVELFDLGGPLPPLDFARRIDDTDADPIAGALADATGRFGDRFRRELRATREDRAASPALAGRYVMVLAAAAASMVWHDDSDPARLVVLDRLDRRLGGAPVLTAAEREDAEHRLFDVTVQRYRDHRLFDLTSRRIPR